ncbi:MAG: IS200/IS605 family transposase [Blastocatellia bacterium]|nr:IS200/IS605 family transposase [Blastocatellia bacterium]
MTNNNQWRTARHCMFKNSVHLVFITKYRPDLLTQNILDRLIQLFAQTCLQLDCELLEFNADVHLIVSVHPKMALSNLVGKLKGKSAYFLRQAFWPQLKQKLWGQHFCSPSYCVVSCGGAPLEIIRKYIESQPTL